MSDGLAFAAVGVAVLAVVATALPPRRPVVVRMATWWTRRRIRAVEWDRPVTAEIVAATLQLPTATGRRVLRLQRRGLFDRPLDEFDPADRDAILALRTCLRLRGNLTPEAFEREFPGHVW